MHPFPKQEDLAFLLTGEPVLQSLAVWPYAVTIGFDNGCSINVGSALTYIGVDGVTVRYDAEWRNEKAIGFHALLEQKMVRLERSDFDLNLVFEKGGQLVIHSDLSMYEAGQIYGPDGSMEVF
jgi:hypothetical protein